MGIQSDKRIASSFIISGVILVLLLAGCNKSETSRASSELTTTSRPASTAQTEAAVLNATPTVGIEPAATETAVPYPPPRTATPHLPYPVQSPTTPPLPTPTPWPTPTDSPPYPTALPTFEIASLSPAMVAAMGVWRPVEGAFPYPVVQVSDTPGGVSAIEWSPDGHYLLLEVATGNNIYLTDAESTSVILGREGVAWHTGGFGNGRCGHGHEWSPDGNWLAFIRDRDVVLARADGGNARVLAAPPHTYRVGSLRFSPDGDQLAVQVTREEGFRYYRELWLYNLTTGAESLLLEDAGGAFTWAPTGDAIAYLGMTDDAALAPVTARLWIVPVPPVAGEPIPFADLDEVPATDSGCLSPPQWLLGGEKVAATVMLRPGAWLADREAAVQLLPTFAELPAQSIGRGTEIAVSADGKYLAYSGSPQSATDPFQGYGYSYDLAAGAVVTRTEWYGSSGVWSPVRPQIASIRWNGSLQVLDILEGARHELDAGSTGYGQQLAWSPDGSRLAYWTLSDKDYTLWLTTLDGERVPLFQARELGAEERNPYYWYDLRPHWSPDGKTLAFVAIREAKPEAFLIALP